MSNPFKSIKPFITKHEPEILMGMGIAGLVCSTVWCAKATFNVANDIKKYKEDKNIDKINFKEFFKLSWKHYLPVVGGIAVSVPCIIAGNRISAKRYTALAAAYTVSTTALREYQASTRQIVGEKKAQQIQENVDAKEIETTYKGTNQIILTGNGDNLFYEPLSGRYFKSTWNKISKAANELNAEALSNINGQITLNDWFAKLGLEDTDMGDELGWDLGNNPNNLIKIQISSHMTKDNVPVGAISYENRPIKINWSSYR